MNEIIVKRTPGTWKVSIDKRSQAVYVVSGDSDNGLAYMYSDGRIESRVANAEFIARACNSHDELLAALQDVISWIPVTEHWHGDGQMKAVDRARAAIAKARGGA